MELQTKSRIAKPTESTQKYLNISEVKDNVLVLRDGSLRAVITVSSTNFALKSEDEQNALTGAFQGFLNSLDFPVQILIHSRILDINGYLEKLRTLASGQTNELLRIQMTEYIEYVGKLVEYASIMSKTFYVIVPYSSSPVTEGGLACSCFISSSDKSLVLLVFDMQMFYQQHKYSLTSCLQFGLFYILVLKNRILQP